MAKIKLTKNELKRQKDALKRFERYLPTLMLKKQQLQMVIRQVEAEAREKRRDRDSVYTELNEWIAVFGEEAGVEGKIRMRELVTSDGNIAGVDIPVFEKIVFDVESYNFMKTPLWVDKGIDAVRSIIGLDAELQVLEVQQQRLNEELQITTQRVNLFEKVKIPETREHIRRIRIYLGDQQTAAVVRGKIAKKNLVQEEIA
ncbi:MAG: V-type ATP synthase subunit D [Spirochaetales bacterium]|nr:V-type ATP synthase subunit D [Spirochaetales bacterium]